MMSILQAIRKDGEYRFGGYNSFWRRFAISHFRLAISLCKFDESWSIHFLCFWITLWRPRVEPKEMMESWGFSYCERCIHLNWRNACKIIYMPWMYDYCKTEAMLADGTFVLYEMFRKGSLERNPEPANKYFVTVPYRYTMNNGEIQERTATVTVDRRSWCWRGIPFRWMRWPSKVRTSIDVEFSDEVGEETGSWKGGCISCGYDLKPGEDPILCLRRMEAERRFGR